MNLFNFVPLYLYAPQIISVINELKEKKTKLKK